MVDPGLALLVFALVAAIALAVAWPRRGLAARIRRLARVSERVRIEDALKYLYHRGAAGDATHADALAGSLQIRPTRARELLERLTERGFTSAAGPAYRLTELGRAEALRIVRSHRLLERYLADRTGIGPDEWHAVAEEHEHLVTADEVESLASRLGQPRYDPHGDPIPTATGELPVSEATLLPALQLGDAGVVVHLEDEPEEAFDRLVALGFALGKTVVVRARGTTSTELELDGATLSIPRPLEEAVSVSRTAARATARARTVADLPMGAIGRVVRISSNCRGAQRRRLLDLGVVPGTEIEAELRSASGDPTAYRIRGALIALRRHQAEWIEIEPADAAAPLVTGAA
ncbi:MAG: FeoA domain-containing protein [Gemmatimonadota bacterium]